MDRGMISLKFALLRNSSRGIRTAGWIIGAVLVLGTWAAAVSVQDDGVRRSVLALSLAGWAVGGMVGPVLMSGAGVLRADYFALLPLSRAVVARGLLFSIFVSIASGFVLLALLASVWHAISVEPVTVVIALVGAVLSWILVLSLSRLVYGLLGAAMRTKLGIEIAGVQFGIMFAAMFTGWMIVSVAVQSIPVLLSRGLPAGPISTVVESFPTSWPLLAVSAAAAGAWGEAVLLLLALAGLDLVLVAATLALLVPRSARTVRRRGRPRSRQLVAGGGLLPATQTGAVIGKEVRQWRRDPWRALESSTAVWTGGVIGVFALLGGYTAPVAAFAGLIVAFMLGLSGCNLYGQDGSAVWQNVVGEDETSVRSDVRGRQWAMVIVFLPRTLLVTVVFLLIGQAWWAVPYLLAAVPATIGAATGAAVLTSAVGVSPGVDPRRRVGPNDANGNIALHVWVVILSTAVAIAPTGLMILWAAASGSPAVSWLAAVVGVVNGVGAAWLLGGITIGYLRTRMDDVFCRIRYGRVFREERGQGVLGWIAQSTLDGEQKMQANKQKQREQKLVRQG
jgi:ABC-2 type transport system permease protein